MKKSARQTVANSQPISSEHRQISRLLNEVDEVQARLARAEKERLDALRERDAYLENLTSVQARCTQLLNRVRSEGELDALAQLIAVYRSATRTVSPQHLVELVGDYARAVRLGDTNEAKAALLDVAAIAIRLSAGEVAS